MATLTIQLPGLEPVAHVLKDETITIGRMRGNTIVIDDASVSLMHAKLTCRQGEFHLKDLNSTNGTVVNGQPVVEVKLNDLDRLRFANVPAQFHAEAVVAAASPPAAAGVVVAQVAGGRPAPPATGVSPQAAHPLRMKSDLKRLLPFAVPAAAVVVAVAIITGVRLGRTNQPDLENPRVPAARDEPGKDARPEFRGTVGADPKPAHSNSAPQTVAAVAALNENVAQLVRVLKDPDAVERRRAARALHSTGPEAREAAAALQEALHDADEEVQMWAALALVNSQHYDKATIPILVRVLRSDNPVLRQVACLSLALIPYEDSEKETVVPALAEAAGRDADDEVRKAALSALNVIAPDKAAKTGFP